jgi:hypothetical protein
LINRYLTYIHCEAEAPIQVKSQEFLPMSQLARTELRPVSNAKVFRFRDLLQPSRELAHGPLRR